jgi:hypothetical protein
MCILDVSFSAVWIGLLIAQASTFVVQVLRVLCLHGSVLVPLGVMFTSCLDLSWLHDLLTKCLMNFPGKSLLTVLTTKIRPSKPQV